MKGKEQIYLELLEKIRSFTEGEDDLIAVMATIACEIYHTLPYCDWAGFYRVSGPGMLKIGPYQGPHACISIPFERGVCGACATTRKFLLVGDVAKCSGYIACSAETNSEIAVPVFDAENQLTAVLDLDSDALNAFDSTDADGLKKIADIFRSIKT